MATVFVAGHGRMDINDPKQRPVPAAFTLKFAVPAKYTSMGRISRNLLYGRVTAAFSDVILEGATYKQCCNAG